MGEFNKYGTDFLFTTPSFWTGVGSVFNIGGNYYRYNYSGIPEMADARALENDWGMVGKDLFDALKIPQPQKASLAKTSKQLSFNGWDD